MSNELVSLDFAQLPSTSPTWSEDTFADLSKSTSFLGRLQLYTKGGAINKRLISPGEYGIPVSKEEIIVLGDSVDVIVMARRPKAVDLSDLEAIVTSYDPASDVFKDIVERSTQPESGCQYGPSFLVYERTTCRFLEFFAGTKSSRGEAGKIYAFCPLTPEMIQARAANGEDVSGVEPHGPKAMNLQSRLIEKGSFSWHVPVVLPCTTPFAKVPTSEVAMAEIAKFLNVNDEGPEKVDAETVKNRRAR